MSNILDMKNDDDVEKMLKLLKDLEVDLITKAEGATCLETQLLLNLKADLTKNLKQKIIEIGEQKNE